jgi:hypothetical protein
MEKQSMSKLLENMSAEELSQYMKDNKNNHEEWQKAYDLFAQKSGWQDAPEGSTWDEQKKFVADFVSQVTGWKSKSKGTSDILEFFLWSPLGVDHPMEVTDQGGGTMCFTSDRH